MPTHPHHKAIILSLGLATWGLSASPASACSCRRGDDARQQIIFQEIMQEPGAVLAEIEAGDSNAGATGGEDTAFKVIATWAGAAPEPLTVHHNTRGSACGMTFEKGERLMLLATAQGGRLMTSQCSQRIASYAKAWGKMRVRELAKAGN